MKDYWEYFGCSKGCPNDTKPVHSHHDTKGCEIVCAHCGALYTYSYEEMQDYYFAPLCNFDEGVACEWEQFHRHFEAVQKFAKDKERERIIGLIHKFREECNDQINYYAKLDEAHEVKRYVHWIQAIDDIRDILGDTEDKEQN